MLKAGHQFQDCASFLTCLAWGFIKNISKQKLHETFHFPILKEHPLSSTFMNDSSTFLKWISFPLSSTFHFPILSYFQNLQNLPENRRPFFRVKFSTSVSHWGTQKVAPGNYGEITICHYNSVYIYIHTGWWFQPLWKIWYSQMGLLFPIYGKIFQTTNQYLISTVKSIV